MHVVMGHRARSVEREVRATAVFMNYFHIYKGRIGDGEPKSREKQYAQMGEIKCYVAQNRLGDK